MRAVLPFLLALSSTLAAQDGPTTWTRTVREVEPAVAHYEALGFLAARREDSRVLFATRGGVALIVTTLEPGPPTDPVTDALAKEQALVVPVDDIDSARQQLERSEVAFEELVTRPSGITSLLAVDPVGHRTILRPARDLKTVAIPGPGELNPLVVEVMDGFPSDGRHRYYWPKKGGWKGNTKDLEYGGGVFADGDPEGRCYCCGLTFEVLLDAWRLWCARNGRPWRIGDLDVDGVKELHLQWFGSAADKSCLYTALTKNRLGFRITDWDDARPGDFVQLWRASGSGHSVVFVAWEREGGEEDGRITGIRYWSTQGATEGIGERVESFEESAGRKRVLRDRFWLCRVGDPGAR